MNYTSGIVHDYTNYTTRILHAATNYTTKNTSCWTFTLNHFLFTINFIPGAYSVPPVCEDTSAWTHTAHHRSSRSGRPTSHVVRTLAAAAASRNALLLFTDFFWSAS